MNKAMIEETFHPINIQKQKSVPKCAARKFALSQVAAPFACAVAPALIHSFNSRKIHNDNFIPVYTIQDRLSALVARFPGYRFRGPGPDSRRS
jgi:hypothetical protein